MSRHWPNALLWLGIVMTRAQTWPLSDVYIYHLTSYIDPHTTSFVNHTQSPRTSYLDSPHVLWQYVVSSYTPPVGLCFYRSKAKATTLPRAGFLPSFHVNATQ